MLCLLIKHIKYRNLNLINLLIKIFQWKFCGIIDINLSFVQCAPITGFWPFAQTIRMNPKVIRWVFLHHIWIKSNFLIFIYSTVSWKSFVYLVPAPFWHLICISFYNAALISYYLGQICIKFDANLASKLKKYMQIQHFLMVLFKMNLVNNISTKASQKESYINNARSALFW